MTEAADPALIGRRVAGKFVVEQFLGGGSMGAIYRARDESLERTVALKVMHPAVAVDPAFVSRFHREARAASRLDHPNSMRVIEFGEEPDGLLYIAMEYLEGRDLYKVIHEDWPLSDARIADIMMEALSAIAVAHEMGVIHRDLKPENIMILNRKDDEGNDVVKVCDFGIAKITEKDDDPAVDATPKTAGAKVTTAGLVVGTPEYMSPEQARGEKLDSRSDLYSMGIILYQLLTGRTPFLAETALAVVLKHITETPDPPRTIYPDVHTGLEAVCMRALAKPKEERWQSAREMRAALKAAIAGRPLPIGESAVTAVDQLAERTANSSRPSAAANGASGSAAAVSSSQSPEALASSAPTLGMSVGASKATPLVAALTATEEKRSRAPLFVAGALGLLVLGGAGLVLSQQGEEASGEVSSTGASATATATASAPPATTSTTATKRDVKPSSTATSVAASAAPATSNSAEAKTAKQPPLAMPPLPVPKAAPEKTAPVQSATAHENAHEPLPAPAPTPEPHATVAPTAKPEPSSSAPAPVPAFNPATCRATLGAPRSTSGFNVKDLTLRGTDAAWSSCAKSAIKERPAGPLGAAVRIRFDDNKVFRGATCTGCTPALAQCVTSSTAKTASVSFKSGDVTGDPEFEVPVTFTCD